MREVHSWRVREYMMPDPEWKKEGGSIAARVSFIVKPAVVGCEVQMGGSGGSAVNGGICDKGD